MTIRFDGYVTDDTLNKAEDYLISFSYVPTEFLRPGPGPVEAISTGQGVAIDFSVIESVGALGMCIIENTGSTNPMQFGPDDGAGNIVVCNHFLPNMGYLVYLIDGTTYRVRGVGGTTNASFRCFLSS